MALLLRQLTHLEVDVRFFEKVTLLDSSLRFNDKVLRCFTYAVYRPRPSIQWNSRRVMLMPRATGYESTILSDEKSVLWQRHSRLEDFRGLHPDLLSKAAVTLCLRFCHVKLRHHDIEKIELFQP